MKSVNSAICYCCLLTWDDTTPPFFQRRFPDPTLVGLFFRYYRTMLMLLSRKLCDGAMDVPDREEAQVRYFE